MKRTIATFTLLALLIAPAVASDAPAPFVAARYDEAAHVVRFWPLVLVDWEKLAHRHFHRFDIDNPPPERVDYLSKHIWEGSGDAEITVHAPLEPRVARGTYSLIAAAGIVPIRPASFDVYIGFRFDQSKPPVLNGRSFSGDVVSRRIAARGGGGIVYWSPRHERPVRIESAKAAVLKEGAKTVLFYTDAQSHASVIFAQDWRTSFLAAYGLRIAGERYLFVAWPPDTEMHEAGCLHSFALYAVRGESLEEVSSNDYDCDV